MQALLRSARRANIPVQNQNLRTGVVASETRFLRSQQSCSRLSGSNWKMIRMELRMDGWRVVSAGAWALFSDVGLVFCIDHALHDFSERSRRVRLFDEARESLPCKTRLSLHVTVA